MSARLRALIEDELNNSDDEGDIDPMQIDNDNDQSDSDWTDHETAMSEEDDVQEAPQPDDSTMQRQSPPPRDMSPVAPVQSSSETSDSEDDVAPVNNTYKPIGTPYVAKDGIEWGKNPPRNSKTRDCNRLRGPIGPAANIPPLAAITSPIDVFMLFLGSIIDDIVKFTNIEAARVYDINSYKTEWKPCDRIEMQAFIGLILMAGVLKDSKSSLNKLWSVEFGPAYFRATLSLCRFKQLLRYIRFDDRTERPADDKFAPIRNIFNTVVRKLGELYTPSVNITVDEQLVPFRGKCGFRQYMPSKPDKYGIKFFWACDSETYYPLFGMVYLGKVKNKRAAPGLGSRIVRRLTKSYRRTGRNITCDNYFTDLKLARYLLRHGLTLVGTVRKNKRFLPEEFKPSNARAEKSSVFGFQYDATIVSHVPAKGKSVALLSTMHHDDKISDNDGNPKPEIILYYNLTKGGVDTMDQMVHEYTCVRQTRRWPMNVFYNLLDIMALASFIIWNQVYPAWNERKKSYKRRLFLSELTKSLVLPQLERRYKICRRRTVRNAMLHVLTEEQRKRLDDEMRGERELLGTAPAATAAPTRARCYYCPRGKDRKTMQKCCLCARPACIDHSVTSRFCPNCTPE